jgi:probable rRNA maturation factor
VDDQGRPRLGGPRRIGGEGEPEVFCADEQDEVTIDLARWRTLAERVLTEEGVRGGAELTVVFVDRDEMALLNEEHLGGAGPTDVLAFPLDLIDGLVVEPAAGPGGPNRAPGRRPGDVDDLPLLLGDVVVCPSVARDQAPEHAGTLDDEVALLVVHGVLHVLGWDHDDAAATERMRARERQLLEAHHWGGPAPTGFRQEQE